MLGNKRTRPLCLLKILLYFLNTISKVSETVIGGVRNYLNSVCWKFLQYKNCSYMSNTSGEINLSALTDYCYVDKIELKKKCVNFNITTLSLIL